MQAEIDVINASWDAEGESANLADSIGLMVYEGTQALNYVKNYAHGADQWQVGHQGLHKYLVVCQGFPITASIPNSAILLGVKGASSSATITTLAKAAVDQDLLGVMVWYASIKNGFHYTPFWDASTHEDSIAGFKEARRILTGSQPRTGLDWSDYIRGQ